jgi:hypothetical protein
LRSGLAGVGSSRASKGFASSPWMPRPFSIWTSNRSPWAGVWSLGWRRQSEVSLDAVEPAIELGLDRCRRPAYARRPAYEGVERRGREKSNRSLSA